MIKLISPAGKTIATDLTPDIERILESVNILWFEAVKKPIEVPEKTFNEIDALISRPQATMS